MTVIAFALGTFPYNTPPGKWLGTFPWSLGRSRPAISLVCNPAKAPSPGRPPGTPPAEPSPAATGAPSNSATEQPRSAGSGSCPVSNSVRTRPAVVTFMTTEGSGVVGSVRAGMLKVGHGGCGGQTPSPLPPEALLCARAASLACLIDVRRTSGE